MNLNVIAFLLLICHLLGISLGLACGEAINKITLQLLGFYWSWLMLTDINVF